MNWKPYVALLAIVPLLTVAIPLTLAYAPVKLVADGCIWCMDGLIVWCGARDRRRMRS